MRVLWLNNVILPKVAEAMGKNPSVLGGWLVELANHFEKDDKLTLGVCFPLQNEGELQKGKVSNIQYYGFPYGPIAFDKYDQAVERYFEIIIEDFKPDIVHIWGTEFPYSLAMTKVFDKPERTVISIQGLCSIYSTHYYASLPQRLISSYTFRDFIKQDNLKQQMKKFYKRGIFEVETIKRAEHVIGRTDWDKACVSKINQNVKYHFCNETLRKSFYENSWTLQNCTKHAIFVSQCDYPIKGFHYLLDTMPYILSRYPNTQVFTTGKSVFEIPKYRISSYQKYIAELIVKNDLKEHVHFLGTLNEREMAQRYLDSHVFVSASSIENSSNSVGEAMMLGVPIVSSDVGGIKNLLNHNTEGFIYQHDAPYMLGFYICEIFNNDHLALEFSENAQNHARKTHDIINNSNSMTKIYELILNA